MSRIGSAIALRLNVFQPDFVSYANQVAQRSNIDRGLPKDRLDLATGHVVQLFSRIKQAVHNVWHRSLPRSWASIALRFVLNTLFLSSWGVLMIAGAWWVRFDSPIWSAL